MEQLKEWDLASKQNFSEKEFVNMQLLVNQCVNMFQRKLEQKGIKIEVDVEAALVNVNSGAISQVISNLLDNAINYYEGSGSIEIKGEVFRTEFTFSITSPGKEIPHEQQERIFERFYRTDPARSKESGGSGLGLAISKEIIVHHKGKISVKSNRNQHTFLFTLPFYGDEISS